MRVCCEINSADPVLHGILRRSVPRKSQTGSRRRRRRRLAPAPARPLPPLPFTSSLSPAKTGEALLPRTEPVACC